MLWALTGLALQLTTPTLGWLLSSTQALADDSFTLERFGEVKISYPSGTPRGFVIFLAGDDTQGTPAKDVVAQVTQAGFVIASIQAAHYLKALQDEEEGCLYIGGEFERLGQVLQYRAHLSRYRLPILLGTGMGGALAYVVGVQAPKGFHGAFSYDFCPTLPMTDDFCEDADPDRTRKSPTKIDFTPVKDSGLEWDFLPGASCLDATKPFEAFRRENPAGGTPAERLSRALDSFAKPQPLVEGASSLDLPLVELPAPEKGKSFFVVFISGDGGWAGIDRELGEYLNKAGISVLGFDALRYYWKQRTPQEAAASLQSAIEYYKKKWVKKNVVLLGYSFGADVLPFLINLLPAEQRASITAAVLLSASKEADFEIHLTDWVGWDTSSTGLFVKPEVAKMKGVKTLCIWGTDEDDALCPELPKDLATSVGLPGDHHFDGDYEKVAEIVIPFLGK